MALCTKLYFYQISLYFCLQEVVSQASQKTQLQSQDSGFGSQEESQKLLETDSQMEGLGSTPMDVDHPQSDDKSEPQPSKPILAKTPVSPVPSKKPSPPESPDTLSLMCEESLDDSDSERDRRTVTPPRGTEILHTQVYNATLS